LVYLRNAPVTTELIFTNIYVHFLRELNFDYTRQWYKKDVKEVQIT